MAIKLSAGGGLDWELWKCWKGSRVTSLSGVNLKEAYVKEWNCSGGLRDTASEL